MWKESERLLFTPRTTSGCVAQQTGKKLHRAVPGNGGCGGHEPGRLEEEARPRGPSLTASHKGYGAGSGLHCMLEMVASALLSCTIWGLVDHCIKQGGDPE